MPPFFKQKLTMEILDYLKRIDEKLDRVLRTKKTWLSVKFLSEYISNSESKIRQLISKNSIPFHKIDGTIRFSRKQIDIWIHASNMKPTEDQEQIIKLYLE